MRKLCCAVLAALVATCALAGADVAPQQPADNWPNNWPYQKREWPDGPNKEFLKNLQRPDNYKNPWRDKHSQLCCDAGDTVKTKFKVEPGDGAHPEDRWYALINGQWKPVPPDKIVPSYAPDGQAFLFM